MRTEDAELERVTSAGSQTHGLPQWGQPIQLFNGKEISPVEAAQQ